jgi:hypothetical protein
MLVRNLKIKDDPLSTGRIRDPLALWESLVMVAGKEGVVDIEVTIINRANEEDTEPF